MNRIDRARDPKCRVAYNDEGLLEEAVTDGDAHIKRISEKGWFLSMGRSDGSELCLRFECNAMLTEDRLAIKAEDDLPTAEDVRGILGEDAANRSITPGSLRLIDTEPISWRIVAWSTAATLVLIVAISAGVAGGILAYDWLTGWQA